MRISLFAFALLWIAYLNRRYTPPALLAVRARCATTWDMVAMRLCQLLTLLLSLLGGNDVPMPLIITGLFLYCAGQILILVAANENPYFIPTITPPPVVITTGVYKHLRHPGYVGHMISIAGVWLMWSSLFALVPLLGFMGLLIWRAHKENGVIQPKSWNASSLLPPRSSP